MRDLTIDEMDMVFGGRGASSSGSAGSSFGSEIVVTGRRWADRLDNVSSAAGWAADGIAVYAGFVSLTAAAQGGLDVPNDAAAGALWAGAAAAKATQFVTHGLASGIRYLEP